MATFDVVRHSSLPVAEAWARLTEWERHGEFLPFTTVRLTGPSVGAAATFVARTSFGPLGFDDPMEVAVWQPPAGGAPGLCRVSKRGSVVTGWAQLTVSATPKGALVHWHEQARFRAAGRLLDWPNRIVGGLAFGRLVDGLLAES